MFPRHWLRVDENAGSLKEICLTDSTNTRICCVRIIFHFKLLIDHQLEKGSLLMRMEVMARIMSRHLASKVLISPTRSGRS